MMRTPTQPRAAAGAILFLLLLLQVANTRATRAGYRLPQAMGRSAGSAADVGSGRDLFKKFLLWRGLFPQEPPRENIIVIPQQSPIFTTLSSPTTTTTTTTVVNGTNTRRWRNLEDLPAPTLPTSQMADNRGAQKRVTKRTRPNAKTRANVANVANGQQRKQRRKKKKTRHRHIHKRQRQQRWLPERY